MNVRDRAKEIYVSQCVPILTVMAHLLLITQETRTQSDIQDFKDS